MVVNANGNIVTDTSEAIVNKTMKKNILPDKIIVYSFFIGFCLLIFSWAYRPSVILGNDPIYTAFISVGARYIGFILLVISSWRSVRILKERKKRIELPFFFKLICYISIIMVLFFLFVFLSNIRLLSEGKHIKIDIVL